MASPRIQRMRIQLQRYADPKVDRKELANIEINDDVNAYVDMITSALPITDIKKGAQLDKQG